MAPLFSNVLAFGLTIAANNVVACMPGENENPGWARGADCSSVHVGEQFGEEGLTSAEDLGYGFVSQVFYDGTACAWSRSYIVTDCEQGRAVIFGIYGYPSSAMTPEEAALFENRPSVLLKKAVKFAASSGSPLELEEVLARARTAKMDNAAIVNISPQRIGISNSERAPERRYDLNCACKLHYPTIQRGNQ